MAINFEEVMSKETDAELLKIVTGPIEDYQPIALEAAKKEFAKRNLSAEKIEAVKQEIEQDIKSKENQINEPLGISWKILTFLLPGIFYIIVSLIFKADGYEKKAKELQRWTLYAIAFYVGFVVLILFLNRFF